VKTFYTRQGELADCAKHKLLTVWSERTQSEWLWLNSETGATGRFS